MNKSQSENILHNTGFLRIDKVLEIIPVGKSSWWAGINSGLYPKGIKIGAKTVGWRIEDIEQLIKDLSNGKAETYAADIPTPLDCQ